MLSFLSDGQTHTLDEVTNALAGHFKLSEDELRIKVSSGQMGLFKNRVTWARTYLKYAGLLSYPARGIYQITEAGKNVLKQNISYINIAYLRQFDDFNKWRSTFAKPDEIATESTTDNETPEEVLGNLHLDLKNKLAYELLELLKAKPFNYFEFFVLALLNKMGYGGVDDATFQVVGKSGDNGIDGIIYEDKLGIDRIYVQAKRWTDNKVQSKDIRDFIGSLSLKGTNKGVFITTSDFTEDAKRTAEMNPQNRIILINGIQLTEHAIAYNVGVHVKKTYEVKDIDTDFFEES